VMRLRVMRLRVMRRWRSRGPLRWVETQDMGRRLGPHTGWLRTLRQHRLERRTAARELRPRSSAATVRGPPGRGGRRPCRTGTLSSGFAAGGSRSWSRWEAATVRGPPGRGGRSPCRTGTSWSKWAECAGRGARLDSTPRCELAATSRGGAWLCERSAGTLAYSVSGKCLPQAARAKTPPRD
jgi:hypothetical protein